MFSSLSIGNWLAIIGIVVALIIGIVAYRSSRNTDSDAASSVKQKTKGKQSAAIVNTGKGSVTVSFGNKDD